MFYWKKSIAIELFDNEFLLANLDTGLYYTLKGPAVAFLANLPFEDFDKELGSFIEKNDTNKDEKLLLSNIWCELIEQELITDYPSRPLNTHSFLIDETKIAHHSNLTTYADMKDLLLLDPIHEVDTEGWPKTNETSSAKDGN